MVGDWTLPYSESGAFSTTLARRGFVRIFEYGPPEWSFATITKF